MESDALSSLHDQIIHEKFMKKNLKFIIHLPMNGKSGIIKKQLRKHLKSDRSISMCNAFYKY